MDVYTRINRLLQRVKRRGIDTEKAKIYAEGVKEKLLQVDYAISRIQSLESTQIFDSSTDFPTQIASGKQDEIGSQISFYCDSIWDILWASIDITGQLINELMGLGLTEKRVSFYKVMKKLTDNHTGNPVTKKVLELNNGLALKRLKKYRHCSTHRRPVYIRTALTTTTVSGRPGYNITELNTQYVKSYICDNPLSLKPIVTNREVLPFCIVTKNQVDDKISNIVNKL